SWWPRRLPPTPNSRCLKPGRTNSFRHPEYPPRVSMMRLLVLGPCPLGLALALGFLALLDLPLEPAAINRRQAEARLLQSDLGQEFRVERLVELVDYHGETGEPVDVGLQVL